MESKDLRIGNLFYKIDRTQKVHMPIEVPMVVAEIGIPFVKFYPLGTPIHQVVNYFNVELFSMTPITLTEEWLVKFGFEEVKPLPNDEHKWSTYSKNGVHIDLPYFEFNLEEITIEIKSVHQLQNLYYALTQTELIIKQ